MDVKAMFLARCLVSAVIFLGAAAVMCADKDGWGFLLIIGVLSLPSYVSDDED